jgi:hypothetical protein
MGLVFLWLISRWLTPIKTNPPCKGSTVSQYLEVEGLKLVGKGPIICAPPASDGGHLDHRFPFIFIVLQQHGCQVAEISAKSSNVKSRRHKNLGTEREKFKFWTWQTVINLILIEIIIIS